MININGNSLTLDMINNFCTNNDEVRLDSYAKTMIDKSRQDLEILLDKGTPVYGINTGFGTFANKIIAKEKIKLLNRNLIKSHAVGFGEPLKTEFVRAAMLIRANTLAKGYSGVRSDLINLLLEMLNKKVTPIIRSQGSLGSSGDLCMLSQLALVLTKNEEDLDEESGLAEYKDEVFSGKEAMEKANITRIELKAKEGLALINGATFSSAMAALTINKAFFAINLANHASALTLEALLGRVEPFDARVHAARGLSGQKMIASEILNFIAGSTLANSGNQVQDPYSIRCIPQIHGAILDTLKFSEKIIEREINAATDNPLIFGLDIISGGNFHGEPIALTMDYLAIALTELAAVSERRIFQLTDSSLNHGLPHMLVGINANEGLNSGMMIPQYTAASLVLENRTLASPDSIQSLPTSANQEDHNANSMTASRHASQILSNTLYVLSIEMCVAVRALQIRQLMEPGKKMSIINEKLFNKIIKYFPYMAEDQIWSKGIDRVFEKIMSGEII